MELPFIDLPTVIMKHNGQARWLAENRILLPAYLSKLAALG